MNTYINLNDFYKIEEDIKKLTIKFYFGNFGIGQETYLDNKYTLGFRRKDIEPIIWKANSKQEYIDSLFRLKEAIKNNNSLFLLDVGD